MKERLIKLINSYPCMSTAEDGFMESISNDLADYLLDNGVIVLPCAVGDYVEWDNGLIKTLYCVWGYMCDDAGFRFVLADFAPVINHRNITRILTKEEAEKALKEKQQ